MSAGELFTKDLQLDWLPDELLFSLVSRYHHLSHNCDPSTTCRQLFGHRQQGCAHDFPSRIDAFVEKTGGALGDAETIIRQHTILPFYLVFQERSACAAAIDAMRGPGIGSLKYKLGLLTSRFRANHPLKACQQCMQEDRQTLNVAYWHRQHQLPGVWVCLTHMRPLLVGTRKSTGVGRFSWCLPREADLRSAWFNASSREFPDMERLALLAHASTAVANLPSGTHIDPGQLVSSYRRGLRSRNLMRGNPGRLRLSELAQSYLSFVSPVTCVPELACLPTTMSEALAQVPRLVRPDQKATHPLRHVTLMTWIFGDWHAALADYISPTKIEQQETLSLGSRESAKAQMRSAKQQRFLTMLSAGSHTISGAARAIGIDPTTGMVWAAKAGYSTKRRSKTLSPELVKKLIATLKRGKDVHEIAEASQTSVVIVRKILRTEVGLYDLWHRHQYERSRNSARAKWSAAASGHPLFGVKAIRSLEPAVFIWLYRHDRQWLNFQVAGLIKHPRSNYSKIDWKSRDASLARSIREAILRITSERPDKAVELWRIYQDLPDLKSKLSKLDRLPLCKEALLSVETTPHYRQDIEINAHIYQSNARSSI